MFGRTERIEDLAGSIATYGDFLKHAKGDLSAEILRHIQGMDGQLSATLRFFDLEQIEIYRGAADRARRQLEWRGIGLLVHLTLPESYTNGLTTNADTMKSILTKLGVYTPEAESYDIDGAVSPEVVMQGARLS